MAIYKAEKLRNNGNDYEFIPPLPTKTERGGVYASQKDDSYNLEIALGSDGKLYAENAGSAKFIQWSSVYTVTYYVDEGDSNVYKYERESGVDILNPTEFKPTKDGWTFKGWRKDKTASGDTLTNETMGDNAVTLYAVFSKKVTANFYSGEAKANHQPLNGTAYYNNTNISEAPIEAPEGAAYTGWDWIGWSKYNNTTANGTVAYDDGDIVNVHPDNSGLSFYGLYQKLVTLKYSGNGATSGSISDQTEYAYYNSAGKTKKAPFVLAAANTFARTGYTFSKWSLGNADTTVELLEDSTATAQWTDNSYYAIQSGIPKISTSYFTLYDVGHSSGKGTETEGTTGGTYYGGYGHTNGDDGYWGIATGNIPTNGCKYLSVTPFAYLWGSYDIEVPLLQVYGDNTLLYSGYPTTDMSGITGGFNAQGTNGWSNTWNVSNYSTVRVIFRASPNHNGDYYADIGITHLRLYN